MDEYYLAERATRGMSPQETVEFFGYGCRAEGLGELAVRIQVERWRALLGERAVAAFLANREREVAEGKSLHDPEWPEGYQHQGRIYHV